MTRIALLGGLVLAAAAPAAPPVGFTPKVAVAGPTRLDWTFVVTTRSLPAAPPDLLARGYESAKQAYDLYLPPRKDPTRPVPAVVFVPAADDPGGAWKAFEPACTQHGFAFVGVRGAGNGVPAPRRVRVILDCLDDLRRRVPLDPDRTYIAGFSGGARIACGVAFALPEYFGGVLPVGAGGELREESWLTHRAADRLSAALVTGQTDFNRGEVERWKGPYWAGVGIRTKVWVQPNTGHALPPAATLTEALAWLDADKDRRASLAKAAPASRASATGALTREQDAEALFKEGRAKLAARPTQHAGLMQVKGVAARWPDLDAGKAARKLLEEYDARPARPWEADDVAEQRKRLAAQARSLGDYALNGIPPGSPYLKQRPEIARRAVEIWSLLIADSPDSELANEGRKLVAELEPLANK